MHHVIRDFLRTGSAEKGRVLHEEQVSEPPSHCSASMTGCGPNWPPGLTRRPAECGDGPRPQAPEAGPDRFRGRGIPTGEWLTLGHRRAKTITNLVVNRWGDDPDTLARVRDRAARANSPELEDLLAGVNDKTIALAIRASPTSGNNAGRPCRRREAQAVLATGT